MKKIISPLLIFIASVCWGLSCVFVRRISALGFSNNEINFLRFFLSAIIICIIYFLFNKKAYKIKLKDVWIFICSGAISMFLTSLCYFSTQINASVSIACILMYTAPIFVTILSKFIFKEKLTLIKILCLISAFTGIVLCSFDGNVGNITFPIFIVGLGSGIFYASYSIFSRIALNKGYLAENILLYSFIFGSLASSFSVDYSHFFGVLSSINYNIIDPVLLSTISTVLAYMTYTLGLKGVETSTASIIACMEIVVATLVGVILYSEIPSILAIFGLIIVITSVVALNLIKPKKHNLEVKLNDKA